MSINLKAIGIMRVHLWVLASLLFCLLNRPVSLHADTGEFQRAYGVLKKYCAGCHNASDSDGEFSLENFETMMKGGESGPAITPGSSASSRLVQLIRGKLEPAMPPEGEARPSEDEVQWIVDWIDAGAMGPKDSNFRMTLESPKIGTQVNTLPISSIAHHPASGRTARGRYTDVEILNRDGNPESKVSGLEGKVHDLLFSRDGAKLYIATGVTGLRGLIHEVDSVSGKITRTLEGHRDICCDLDLNEDGTLLASASYDRVGIVWELATGQIRSRLQGHNGAIHQIRFVPGQDLLATASDDATVKIWSLDGNRIDTRGEPLKEQYAIAFEPNGNFFVAGGADNRIRKWRLESTRGNQTNPLEAARFAHQSAIEYLAFHTDGKWVLSIDSDGVLKVWDAGSLLELTAIRLGGSVSALSVSEQHIQVGMFDGTFRVMAWPKETTKAVSPVDAESIRDLPNKIGDAEPNRFAEVEPNNSWSTAQNVGLPFVINGKLTDEQDLFSFEAKQGEKWIFETKAARSKSNLDSRIEILDSQGKRIPRVRLQAVRDSYFTFRGKNSSQASDFRIHNWEEMQLGQLLYCEGEVVRLYHYPRGPDSGFNVYPNFGSRHTFFDTTALSHALNEPCYIVEAHRPDAEVPPTGLPSFMLYYENDDDSRRRLGKDSLLTFVVPEDGKYFVRLTDSRGQSGEDYRYELSGRVPSPGFKIRSLENANPKLFAGTHKRIGIQFERLDGFQGDVSVELRNLPKGYSVSGPTTLEAGELRCWLALNVDEKAQPVDQEGPKPEIVATATIHGQEVQDKRSLGKMQLEAKQPTLKVRLHGNRAEQNGIPVIELCAGETIPVKLSVERLGHKGRVNFGQESAAFNVPFGVYVDRTGLNGVLIPPGETEREFYLTAEPFVEPCERLIFVEAHEAGRPASNPVLLRILKRED